MSAICVEELLVSRLVADPAVAALIADRVYPVMVAPGAALPLIVYERTTTSELQTSDEKGYYATVTVHCWALSYLGAKTLARRVRECFRGWKASEAGVEVEYARPIDERDEFEFPTDGSTRPVFGVSIDLYLPVTET